MADAPEQRSSRKSLILVPVVLIGLPLLFYLAYQLGRAQVSGNLVGTGGPAGAWSVDVDECHTSYDFAPGYKGIQVGASAEPGYYLRVLRDVGSKLLPGSSIEITHGPNEVRTDQDDRALARYAADRWVIQLLTPHSATPVRIEPEMCSRFALVVDIETTKQRVSSGSVELSCSLPSGGQLTAQVRVDDCM